VLYTLKIFATACFTQLSNNLTELLVNGMASVAYKINGRQYISKPALFNDSHAILQ